MRSLHLPQNQLLPKRGITRVEVLVIVGIMVVLIAVTYPLVDAGSLERPESVWVQKSHDLSLALFNYAEEHGAYPSGTTPDSAFLLLYQGGYIPPDGDFFIISGTPGKKPAVTVSGKAPRFTASNNCWGYTTRTGGAGLLTSDPDRLPLVASIGFTTIALQSNTANIIAINADINPFGHDGIVVGYRDMSSSFMRDHNNIQISD